MVRSGYDSLLEGVIPGYASLARLSVTLLATSPLAQRSGASVLVAGCGSGAELLEAVRLRPDWQLTALDPSTEMLTLAQENLRTLPTTANRIQWMQGTVEHLAPEPAFDGAMAVLVMQGLPDDGSKLRFLSALFRSLRPGGQVVLVDRMQPERNGIEQQLVAASQMFQRAGLADENSNPSRGDSLGEIHAVSLSRLTGLLEISGFSDPLPVFRALDTEGFLFQRLS